MRIALALLTLASALHADDWPQWRGPGRDGVWSEKGILERFPADGLKVRWRAPLGAGYSSPVIAQGRVFATGAELGAKEKRDATERIHCFEEATGRALWTFSYPVKYPEWCWEAKEGPASTPVVHDGRLYVSGGFGQIFCFEAATGKALWKRNLSEEYGNVEFWVRGSLLIEGDLLIVPKGYGGSPGLVAIRKDTGEVAWTALEEGGYNSSPIVVTSGGRRQLIVPCRYELASLDPATGSVLWRQKFECGIPTPVLSAHGLLVNGLMLDLDTEKPGARILWPARKSEGTLSDTTTAAVLGDLVVSHKKPDRLVCLDAKTGKLLWEETGVKSVTHTLIVAGDGVFLYTDEGVLIRARISAEGFKEVSRTPLIKPTNRYGKRAVVYAAPGFANRHVFVRNDEELVCASLAADP